MLPRTEPSHPYPVPQSPNTGHWGTGLQPDAGSALGPYVWD